MGDAASDFGLGSFVSWKSWWRVRHYSKQLLRKLSSFLQRGLILSTAVGVIPQPSPFCTLVTAILSPRKTMSFSRLPRLTSAVRTLHTSCPARQPAANPTEIFQKAFGERAAAQTSPLMKNEVQDNREQFKANQVRLYPFSSFFLFLLVGNPGESTHVDIKADSFGSSQLF